MHVLVLTANKSLEKKIVTICILAPSEWKYHEVIPLWEMKDNLHILVTISYLRLQRS